MHDHISWKLEKGPVNQVKQGLKGETGTSLWDWRAHKPSAEGRERHIVDHFILPVQSGLQPQFAPMKSPRAIWTEWQKWKSLGDPPGWSTRPSSPAMTARVATQLASFCFLCYALSSLYVSFFLVFIWEKWPEWDSRASFQNPEEKQHSRTFVFGKTHCRKMKLVKRCKNMFSLNPFSIPSLR